MGRKNDEASESLVQLVLGLPGLLLVAALFYRPLDLLLGRYAFVLFDWCLIQSLTSLVVVGIALVQRRRTMFLWSLYCLFSAALPLIVISIVRNL